MKAKWADAVMRTTGRRNVEEEGDFLRLVDQADGYCDLARARVLLKTFSAQPDHGTQERVVSVLMTASDHDRLRAITEELPRLVNDAREWAIDLVGGEVRFRSDPLREFVATLNPIERAPLVALLADDAFQAEYPEAKDVLLGA